MRNHRQQLFVHEYLVDVNGAAAAVRAGYSKKGADVRAAILMKKPEIRAAIDAAMAKKVERVEATVERVLEEMTRLAFYDITAVFDVQNGKITLRDPTKLPEDLRRAIVGIKPVQIGETLQYECKFADKQRALDSLARHLQMFKDMVIVENVFRIVKEMEDDELDRRLTELERAFDQAATLDPAAGEGSPSVH